MVIEDAAAPSSGKQATELQFRVTNDETQRERLVVSLGLYIEEWLREQGTARQLL